MPGIAGALNLEVRLPLAEGPGFIELEDEDEGAVAIGVMKENGAVYAYSRITADQWWRRSRALFPEGDPQGGAEVRRSSD